MISIFSDGIKNHDFDCQNALHLTYTYANLFKSTQARFLVIFENFIFFSMTK